MTATASATVAGPDGKAQVVTRPVVVPSGSALPTTEVQLRAAAGLPTVDVAVNAEGEVTGTATVAATPVAWRDPADSLGRTAAVLGGAAAAIGTFLYWLLRRRRADDAAPTHAV